MVTWYFSVAFLILTLGLVGFLLGRHKHNPRAVAVRAVLWSPVMLIAAYGVAVFLHLALGGAPHSIGTSGSPHDCLIFDYD